MYNYNYGIISPVEAIKKNASMNANKTAIIYNKQKISYLKLMKETNKVSKAFLQNRIMKDQNIPVLANQIPETIYTILGIGQLGCSTNMLDSTFSEEEMYLNLKRTYSKLLIVEESLYKKYENIIKKLDLSKIIIIPQNKYFTLTNKLNNNEILWKDFINIGKRYKKELKLEKGLSNHFSTIYSDDNEPLKINSGNYSYMKNLFFNSKIKDFTGKFYTTCPYSKALGQNNGLFLPLLLNQTVVLDNDKLDYSTKLLKYKPNIIYANFKDCVNVLKDKSIYEKDLSFVKLFFIINNIDKKMLNELKKIFYNVEIAYSNDVVGGIYSIDKKPINEVKVAVFDKETLLETEKGIIGVKAPYQTNGYYEYQKNILTNFKNKLDDKLFDIKRDDYNDIYNDIWILTNEEGYIDNEGKVKKITL